MPNATTFGQRIREARLSRGMSLGQLAAAVGHPAASVRTWERDEAAPDTSEIASIANLLELDAMELEELAAGNGGSTEVTVEEPVEEEHLHVTEADTDPVVTHTARDEAEAEAARADAGLDDVSAAAAAEQPTEAVALPPGPESAEEELPEKRRFLREFFTALYDPDKRWLYWIRSIITVIVMVVMLLVLVWALGELFEALGEVWDSLGSET